MYSNNILNFQESTTILNARTKKSGNLSYAPRIYSKVKSAIVVEGDRKAPFSIASTPKCREGRYSFSLIAPLYPWI